MPGGELVAGAEGDGVVGTVNPDRVVRQLGERGRIPGHTPRSSELVTGGEGVAVPSQWRLSILTEG
jgi:hypothetical protein